MIKGSCCCGAIAFEILTPPTMMGTCHCSRCRKLGASTFVFVPREGFRWVRGREFVTRYEPAAPYNLVRNFCTKCGTALGEPDLDAPTIPIAANCLDEDPGVRNRFHESVAEKPAWYDICDSAPQFAGHPTRTAPSPGNARA